MEQICTERAFKFNEQLGHQKIAQMYLDESLSVCHRWGAKAKKKLLIEQADSKGYQTGKDLESSGKANAVDLETLIQASLSLAVEKNLKNLTEVFLDLIHHNAGADKAVLILSNEDLQFQINGIIHKDMERGEQDYFEKSYQSYPNISHSIVKQVIRNGNPINLEKAFEDRIFSKDGYIVDNKVASILCLPIVNRSELIGVLCWSPLN